MKITVLNGSPKGDVSVTMQYVHFLQKSFPDHDLRIFHIAQNIKRIEKEDSTFSEVIEAVRSSDGVLWAFPLYFFLVASQYKRFIELIFERKAEEAFRDRYAAVLTTSIHFFDHTAHDYMRAICDDLGMRTVGSFSAEMYDLLKEEERKRLTLFGERFFGCIQERTLTARIHDPLVSTTFDYKPGPIQHRIEAGGRRILLVTDQQPDQIPLIRMVDHFRNILSDGVDLVNLNGIEIKGGCLGCLQCGYDNTCVYAGKDEYVDFFNDRVKKADILVFAGTIRDRYLSSRWKLFFDRSFFNTHIPSLKGKQIGLILSGPFRQIPNLRGILEAYTEMQQSNLVGIVTDECSDSGTLDALLRGLATGLVWASVKSYTKPLTFLGIGGKKVFRDEIRWKLRFPFQADHRYYRRNGMYDFSYKDYRARLTSRMLMLLTKIPMMRQEIYQKKIKEGMIKPLRKVVRQGG